jgi:hypothetical protein
MLQQEVGRLKGKQGLSLRVAARERETSFALKEAEPRAAPERIGRLHQSEDNHF